MFVTLIEKIEHSLEVVKKPVYVSSLFILHLVYLLLLLGVIQYTPAIVNSLNIFIQVFICVFLIVKFHPFRKHELKEFDSTIILGSAIFLLTNLGFAQFFTNYFGKKIALDLSRT